MTATALTLELCASIMVRRRMDDRVSHRASRLHDDSGPPSLFARKSVGPEYGAPREGGGGIHCIRGALRDVLARRPVFPPDRSPLGPLFSPSRELFCVQLSHRSQSWARRRPGKTVAHRKRAGGRGEARKTRAKDTGDIERSRPPLFAQLVSAPTSHWSDSGGWTSRASTARLGEWGRNSRHQGGLARRTGPGTGLSLRFPPPRAPPRPACPPSGITLPGR